MPIAAGKKQAVTPAVLQGGDLRLGFVGHAQPDFDRSSTITNTTMAPRSPPVATAERFAGIAINSHLAGCGKSRSVVLAAQFAAFWPFVTH
jgi:hypothetical protein